MRGIHRLRPVVVDEAHLLGREMLEEVRFLLNFKVDAQSPMALIRRPERTVGSPESAGICRIRQRIDLQCKLPHFDRAQTGEYIKSYLAYAGTEHGIFSDGSNDDIYRFSSGAARLINRSAHTP